jgi:head-tail adaptor
VAGIEAGRLKDKIVFLRPVATKDSYGQPIMDWDRIGPVHGSVTGDGGGTSVSISRSSIIYSHTIPVRKSSILAGIEANWRLEYRNQVMEISSVIERDECLYEISAADERPHSERDVIKDADAIIYDKDIEDAIGNSKQPNSPINTRKRSV